MKYKQCFISMDFTFRLLSLFCRVIVHFGCKSKQSMQKRKQLPKNVKNHSPTTKYTVLFFFQFMTCLFLEYILCWYIHNLQNLIFDTKSLGVIYSSQVWTTMFQLSAIFFSSSETKTSIKLGVVCSGVKLLFL